MLSFRDLWVAESGSRTVLILKLSDKFDKLIVHEEKGQLRKKK